MNSHPLPYFAERTSAVSMLMFHCNAFDLETFCQWMHTYKCSVHYFIDTRGLITRLVPEDKSAFHAGKSFWRGINSLNNCSVGIELQSPSLGQTPYPGQQIAALIELSQDIVRRHNIPAQNIIGHSDAAPERKPDPGPCFPWKKLSQNGLGFYPDRRRTPAGGSVEELLTQIGYDASSPEKCAAAAYAFCRRFAPSLTTKDFDIPRLLDNPLPPGHENILQSPLFIKTLQTTAHLF